MQQGQARPGQGQNTPGGFGISVTELVMQFLQGPYLAQESI